MLNAPRESPYDLHFKIFGFHVRTAWGFWILGAVICWRGADLANYVANSLGLSTPGMIPLLLIGIAGIFLSILVHELGHTLAFRYYGIRSSIVLYHFGGLAIPDSFGTWNGGRQHRISAKEQIIISAAGPAFQLGLALIVWCLGLALGVHMNLTGQLNWLFSTNIPEGVFQNSILLPAVFNAILWPSTFWAILNLAPILPFDGGQIMRSLLFLYQVDQPTRTAHMVSVGTGVLLGLYFIQCGQHGGMMFFLFALTNWQQMQSGSGYI